jgi:hypothetical protein
MPKTRTGWNRVEHFLRAARNETRTRREGTGESRRRQSGRRLRKKLTLTLTGTREVFQLSEPSVKNFSQVNLLSRVKVNENGVKKKKLVEQVQIFAPL